MKKLFSMVIVLTFAFALSAPVFASGHHNRSKQHHITKSIYCYNGDGHRAGNHAQHFKGDGHWYCFR